MNRHLQAAAVPFHFSSAHEAQLQQIITQYPEGKCQSAVIAALDLAQRQHNGWISREVVEEVARRLSMPAMRVHEIASFYTMFNLEPIGQYHLQVCTTTPCWLKGSDEVLNACHQQREKYGRNIFTVSEVECLGACIAAPVLQINDDYHENLDGPATITLLDNFAQSVSNREIPRPTLDDEESLFNNQTSDETTPRGSKTSLKPKTQEVTK